MKLTNDEAIQILNAGLATGADFAEIYLQDSKSENIARRYQKPYGVASPDRPPDASRRAAHLRGY